MNSNYPTMKSTKPPVAWRTTYQIDHLNLHVLIIDLMPLVRDDRPQWPLPVYDTQHSEERLVMHFQANRGTVAPGTIDGPDWYGARMELEMSEHSDISTRPSALRSRIPPIRPIPPLRPILFPA